MNDEKTPKHAAQEDEGVLEQDAPEASAPSSDESGPKHAAHAAEEAAPAKSKMFAIVALIAALIVVALVIAGFATGFIGGSAPSQQTQQTEEQLAVEDAVPDPEPASYTVDPLDLDDISGEEEISTFALYDLDAEAPELTDEQEEAIQDAIDSVRSGRNAGFVFIDLNTGKGIAYNAEKEIFGASSFKGPYSLYVCQTAIDGGDVSIDSGTGDLIEAAILYSDNGAYQSLRRMYNGSAFDEWLEDLDIETGHFNKWIFPEYSAQESAKMWEQAYLYQQEGNETAEWLFDLFANTNVSFIRSELDDENVQVWNKAGWVANSRGSGSRSNGVIDAGIIVEEGGHTYIMSVLTDTPYGDSSEAALKNIIRSLFDAREALGWSEDAMAIAKATNTFSTFGDKPETDEGAVESDAQAGGNASADAAADDSAEGEAAKN